MPGRSRGRGTTDARDARTDAKCPLVCATMMYTMSQAQRVGIRELRQKLAGYVDAVGRGRRFVVTERNRAVAQLVPIPREDPEWETLLAEHPITEGAGNLGDLLEEPDGPITDAGSQALEDDRSDRL